MTNLLKNLLIALAVAALLFVGYFFYLKDFLAERSGDGDTISADSVSALSAEEETQNLLARLNLLNSITIDESVFEDTRFKSLIDFREDLGREPVGRKNPFAPINGLE